jgi:predicted dehydrogenase
MKAVTAGKHVLAEKPVALNARQGRALEAAVTKHGVTFMAGYSFRYFDRLAQAKQMLTDGAMGEVKTINTGMSLRALRAGWPSDPGSGGGMNGFFGCHAVDRSLWFLEAEPTEVFADVRYDADSGVDLISAFQVRFAGGATAQFSFCGRGHGPFDFAHICGDAGYMYLQAQQFPHYSLTVSNDTEYATAKTFTSDLDREAAILKKMAAELDDFVDAVRRESQPPITVEDACAVLDILDAVILSGKTGQPVALRTRLKPDAGPVEVTQAEHPH